VMGNAVRDLVDQGYKFRVVGGRSKVPEALKLREDPDIVPPVGSEHWERTVVDALDVSVCPLEASAFNTAKSRLKAIEAMAGGLAWIGSPREEYRRANKESGAGFLAETPKQWITYVKMLMDNESLRHEQGEMGRAYMRDQTYQANAWRWWEAWTDAYKIQHGADKQQVVFA
jgi:glycosyltransferase involved in cell wall biosynthesis